MLYLWASCTLHIHSAGVKQLPAGCRDSLSLKLFQSHLPFWFTAVGPDPRIFHVEHENKLKNTQLDFFYNYFNESSGIWFVHTNTSTCLTPLHNSTPLERLNLVQWTAALTVQTSDILLSPTGSERDSEVTWEWHTQTRESGGQDSLYYTLPGCRKKRGSWGGGGGVTVTAQPSTLQASFNTNRASPGSGRQAGQIEGQWLISLPCQHIDSSCRGSSESRIKCINCSPKQFLFQSLPLPSQFPPPSCHCQYINFKESHSVMLPGIIHIYFLSIKSLFYSFWPCN